MNHGRNLLVKTKNVRKQNWQNWSAPTTMGVFIIVCMIVIFSFETAGLANRERNLEYRQFHLPEKVKLKSVPNNDFLSKNHSFTDKLKVFYMKDREQNVEKINRILYNGANDQINYCKSLIRKSVHNSTVGNLELCGL